MWKVTCKKNIVKTDVDIKVRELFRWNGELQAGECALSRIQTPIQTGCFAQSITPDDPDADGVGDETSISHVADLFPIRLDQ